MKEKRKKTITGQKTAVENARDLPEKEKVQTSESQRKDALRYYLMGLNLPEISLLLNGVSVRTLERWQSTDKWTSAKMPKELPIKERIAAMHKNGLSLGSIASKINKSKTTVHRYVKDIDIK